MDALDVELRSSTATTIRTKLTDSSTYVLGNDGVVVPEHTGTDSGQLRLVTENHQLFVAPSGSVSILVNGKPASGRIPVSNGDWVTVGGTVYQIKLSGAGVAPSPVTMAGSTPVPPGSVISPKTSPTGSRQILIGREKTCTLVIDSPLVSREHARLTHEGDQWLIEDLGSTNGTFVNNQRVQERVALKKGDRLAIASFVYRFTGDGLMADTG
jgi:hypothetical protein